MVSVVRKQHGRIFSQPFTHFFGPTTTASEELKFPLEVKDIIYFFMFLLCLFSKVHSPFRDRVRLPCLTAPKPATEVGDIAQQNHLQSEGIVQQRWISRR